MKLSTILTEASIKTELEAENRFESIEELVDLLISEHELSLRDRDYVLEVVVQREKSISTGIGSGVAIPHGTVDCIDDIVGAMGISAEGIEFDAFDGEPVFIVLLLLVPKNSFGKHIKTLSHIAKVLHHADVRDSIRKSAGSVRILEIIKTKENEID